MKHRFDLERLLGFDVQQDDGALGVHRHKKSLAHREGVAGIKNGGGFRAHGEDSRKRVGGENSAFGEEIQMKFAEKFQRINPRFHFAGFISE